MVDSDELLEWAEVFDNYYGTPKKPVMEAFATVGTYYSTSTGRVPNSCAKKLELIL